MGASIIGGALAGAHDYQLATGAGRFRPRFPQLAAQRLVALRLRRKRDPGQELTVRSNDDSSSRFFSTCPPPPYPTRSRWFRACVCHFEIGYRRPPTRLNRLDDWPFYAPFRLGSIVCRDSGLRGTVIRGGLHPSLRLTDFHSALWIPFFSLQYIYIYIPHEECFRYLQSPCSSWVTRSRLPLILLINELIREIYPSTHTDCLQPNLARLCIYNTLNC